MECWFCDFVNHRLQSAAAYCDPSGKSDSIQDMKLVFASGVVLGLAGVLVGAGLYPWIDHPRLPSRTQVMANGGRAEQFVVRLPLDRITTIGTPQLGVRGTAYPASTVLPDDLQAEPLLLEHFKVRDTEGNVVGVAVRHATSPGEGVSTAWAVTIPSRGTLRLAGIEAPGGLDAALAAAGGSEDASWAGDLRFTVTGESSEEAPGGQVVGGSGEFRGLSGVYSEDWLITGVGDDGELRGTIELSTVTYQGL